MLSSQPSAQPSSQHSSQPSTHLIMQPSSQPTELSAPSQPSAKSLSEASTQLSSQPSSKPSAQPSRQPSASRRERSLQPPNRPFVVNAALGTATALGSALGPAAAIALDQLDLQFDVPWYGAVFINGMTGPGYLMGVLWIVFALVRACTFDEPERSGLREQIQKESKETAPKGAGVTEYEMSNLDASKKSKLNMVLDQPRRVLDSLGCPTEGGLELCPDCPGRLSLADSGETLDDRNSDSLWKQAKFISAQITPPVRVCMFLLFSKMFTVESVISATSMVTKNRYDWAVQQNWGLLATVIGTFGRACGDVFITSVGYIDIRQIMNLLFVPSFIILVLDLILVVYNYDSSTA